jgi:hypothetical protein
MVDQSELANFRILVESSALRLAAALITTSSISSSTGASDELIGGATATAFHQGLLQCSSRHVTDGWLSGR